jgi:SNF2 family DNA or RNA helicase
VVLSYTLLAQSRAKDATKWSPNVLVLDESHYLKNVSSQRSKAVARLASKARYVFLLSGTPLSKHVDLFSQLRLLTSVGGAFWPYLGRFAKGARPRAWNFAARYCNPQLKLFMGGRKIFDFSGDDRRVELARFLGCFLVRRLKEEVLDLPPKTVEHVRLQPLPPETKAWFRSELDRVQTKRESEGSRPAEVILLNLVRETVLLKKPHILSYVRSTILPDILRPDGPKVLLFAHHHVVLDDVAALLGAEAPPGAFITIDGRTEGKHRLCIAEKFQKDPNVRAAVLGISSAGTGLNLYRASLVVFLELGWDEKALQQAEDRAHRLGATREVRVRYLLLPGSTDDMVARAVRRKTERAADVLAQATNVNM